MGTSRRLDARLFGQLECYMDDVVDCFKEFVKKSMLVVSVAVGTLVLMVMYVLKLMFERVASRGITCDSTAETDCKCCQAIQNFTENTAKVKSLDLNTNSFINAYSRSTNSTRKASTQVIPNSYPSLEENCIKAIEMCNINMPCNACKHTQVSEDLKSARRESTPTTTSKEPSVTKNHLSTSRRSSKVKPQRNSCCSTCCGDESCSNS